MKKMTTLLALTVALGVTTANANWFSTKKDKAVEKIKDGVKKAPDLGHRLWKEGKKMTKGKKVMKDKTSDMVRKFGTKARDTGIQLGKLSLQMGKEAMGSE